MDPDANLREQRDRARRVLLGLDGVPEDDLDDLDHDMMHLCELVQALDEWLSKGGFLPRDWRKS